MILLSVTYNLNKQLIFVVGSKWFFYVINKTVTILSNILEKLKYS